DLGEYPADGSAVSVCADLDKIFAAAPSDQLIAAICDRIDPRHPPGLESRVPHPQRGAVHVAGLGQVRRALGAARDDPDILNAAPLQDPAEVDLALDMAVPYVNAVGDNVQLPTADQPAIEV